MKRKTHLARAGLTAWTLLMSVLVTQVAVTAKTKKAATTEKSDEPLTVHVSPRFALVGEWVRAVVRVTPDADNRLLRIMVDSEEYFRSSDVPLDGAAAARTHFMPLKALPAGEYAFLAVVYGTLGERARTQQRFQLLGPQECDRESRAPAGTVNRRKPGNPADLRTIRSVCGK